MIIGYFVAAVKCRKAKSEGEKFALEID